MNVYDNGPHFTSTLWRAGGWREAEVQRLISVVDVSVLSSFQCLSPANSTANWATRTSSRRIRPVDHILLLSPGSYLQLPFYRSDRTRSITLARRMVKTKTQRQRLAALSLLIWCWGHRYKSTSLQRFFETFVWPVSDGNSEVLGSCMQVRLDNLCCCSRLAWANDNTVRCATIHWQHQWTGSACEITLAAVRHAYTAVPHAAAQGFHAVATSIASILVAVFEVNLD